MPAFQTDELVQPALLVTTRHARQVALLVVALSLNLFVFLVYQRVYDPHLGWTRLIMFGTRFADGSLPRLQRTPHYVDPSPNGLTGYDGQFYAQMAIDPSLQDPAFDTALDNPAYRARRIGLPALSFCLGGGKPRRILQVYAVANLGFWFLLAGVLAILLQPLTWRRVLCLVAALLGYGALTSMQASLTDLPAATMILTGALFASRGRYGVFAAAVLTRETSVLAALGFLEPRWPRRAAEWRRALGLLALAGVPFALWLVYVHHRFRAGHNAAVGSGNFALPLQAMCVRFAAGVRDWRQHGPGGPYGNFQWLYMDGLMHELLVIAALVFQGLYLVLRRDMASPFWRTGVCYLALGCVLGSAVWEATSAAARVLLPMTLCFYLQLARERPGWFWPFFVLGGLSIPQGVYAFWTMV